MTENLSNGVTFVDLNNDDWLDIYISQGDPTKDKIENLLYIKFKKDGTFIENAEEIDLLTPA